ncbi:hypothetical protein EMCRGX_G010958 [Ephydatia muelleri]
MIKCSWLPKRPVGDQNICRSGVAFVMPKATANLDLGRYISSPTVLHKNITEFIVAGNHIAPMLATQYCYRRLQWYEVNISASE